jgi:hypothetical protein
MEVCIKESLVVTDIKIGLSAIVGHKDFTMLERVHSPGINIDVGIEFLHRDPETTSAQQSAETRCCEAFA